ncbi:putative protein TPRXL [Eriocheir sinensis]|uniref:putative protein TPRXL n=1 Tax=Eriocheir sinensis TaxID=95602 RepID=UPI0021C67941|nr:putative protein TPRXL [Eriocheir sinensis]
MKIARPVWQRRIARSSREDAACGNVSPRQDTTWRRPDGAPPESCRRLPPATVGQQSNSKSGCIASNRSNSRSTSSTSSSASNRNSTINSNSSASNRGSSCSSSSSTSIASNWSSSSSTTSISASNRSTSRSSNNRGIT